MKNRKHKLITYIALGMAMIGCIITMSGTGKVYCDTITPEQEAALIQQYHGVNNGDGTIFFADDNDAMAFNDARYKLEHPGQLSPGEIGAQATSTAQSTQQPASTTNVDTDTSTQASSTQTTSKEEKKTESVKKADAKQTEEKAKEETTTIDNTPVKNEVTKKPTCTEDGERTYYNKNGDVVKTEKIVATGHDYEKTVAKEPTCTDKGITTYKCKNCGDTYTEEIAALGHQIDKGTVTKKAGMFTAGEKVYKCARCGKVMKTEIIPSQYSMKVLYAIIAMAVAAVIAIVAVIIKKRKHHLNDAES